MYKVIILFISFFVFSSAQPLISVNGKIITTNDAQIFLNASGSSAKLSSLNGNELEILKQRLIERELFLQNAKKTKIEQSNEFKINMQRLKDELLVNMWLKDQMKYVIISDGEAREFYIKNRDKFIEPTMMHAREIVVKNESQAKQIIASLRNLQGDMLKKTFIAIANYSSISRAKQNGGDIGMMSKEQMSPAFADVAWKIKANNIYKKPIKSNIGYHVVFIEEKLDNKQLGFDSVKKDIVDTLKQQQFSRYLTQIVKDMAIKARISYPR